MTPGPLFLYPTRRCNYECSYCYTESGPRRAIRGFLEKNCSRIILEAAEASIRDVRFSGGEPLLLRDLRDYCGLLQQNGMIYSLSTNGALLEAQLNWMRDCPPHTLWISAHFEYVDRVSLCRRVSAASAVLPVVGIQFFAADVRADPEIVVAVLKAGATRIKLIARSAIGRATTEEPGWLTGEEARRLAEQWRGRATRSTEVRLAAPLLPEVPRGPSTCALARKRLLSVDADGRVYPCCVTVGHLPAMLGDLRIETLNDVVQRADTTDHLLPCRALLPGIPAGTASCPLHLEAL